MTVIVCRFRNDPEALPLAGLVSTQEAAAIDERGVVQLAVFLVKVAPIARQMPHDELLGLLPGILEGLKGTGSGHNLTWLKLGILGLVQTHFVSPEWDLWLFTV